MNTQKHPVTFVRNEGSPHPHMKSERIHQGARPGKGLPGLQSRQIPASVELFYGSHFCVCWGQSLEKEKFSDEETLPSDPPLASWWCHTNHFPSLKSLSLSAKPWFCSPLQGNLKPVTVKHYVATNFAIICHMNTNISMQYKLVTFASFISPRFLCISALVTTLVSLEFKVGVQFCHYNRYIIPNGAIVTRHQENSTLCQFSPF